MCVGHLRQSLYRISDKSTRHRLQNSSEFSYYLLKKLFGIISSGNRRGSFKCKNAFVIAVFRTAMTKANG